MCFYLKIVKLPVMTMSNTTTLMTFVSLGMCKIVTSTHEYLSLHGIKLSILFIKLAVAPLLSESFYSIVDFLFISFTRVTHWSVHLNYPMLIKQLLAIQTSCKD